MIERHVVSFDLAQRLKAAGFRQDAVFSWFESDGERGRTRAFVSNDEPYEFTVVCAAPMLSEVMEQVAKDHLTLVEAAVIPNGDHGGEWGAIAPFRDRRQYAPTGPDAAALLWLALKEGK